MTPYYLEDSENKLFIDVNITENSFKIRRGHIGKPCLVFEGTTDRSDILKRNYKSIKASFLERGYQEKQSQHKIIEGSKAGLLRKPEILSHPPYAKIMQIAFMQSDYENKNVVVWHFANGLTYEDDLEVGLLCDTFNFAGVIIEGEVNIKGVFCELGEYFPEALLIIGDVKAKSLVKENSHIVIDGNLVVEQTVHGYYNDGSIRVMGDISGEAMISYDHSLGAEGECYIHGADIFNYGYPDWLNPDFLYKDEYGEEEFDRDTFLKFIFEGKSVLRDGVGPYVPEETPEPTAEPVEEEIEEAPPLFNPELIAQLEPFSMANDNMGITKTLLNWQKRDEGWLELVQFRLSAPSLSGEERKMLKQALRDYKS